MFLVGLTGSIGTGKTTVSQIFISLGVAVIDADKIAREVVLPNSRAWKNIRDSPVFGPEFFTSDGELDRDAVGKRVFADEMARLHLERITHPEIRMEMIRQIVQYALKGNHFVILDVPLLFEKSPLLRFCHKVIVVACSKENQIERLKRRTKWTEQEINQRIAAQLPLTKKVRLADFVINNDGSITETERQVEDLFNTLLVSQFHWIVRGIFLTGVMLMMGVVALLMAFLRWLF